ncbi:MAG: DUF2927 domain-containing protein [Minwuia sp.]|uniref:DUF2927 domain-containing protein n=1 Tax=Minwuia sp. TaxID=2493630 RepID=UPI003A8A4748
MRVWGTIATLVTVLAWNGIWQAPAAQVLPEADISAAFDQAAFGPGSRDDARVYRWRGPVRVRHIGPAAPRHLAWVRDQIAELSELTGLDIEETAGIDSDLSVVFVPTFQSVLDGDYNELLDQFTATTERRDALLEGFRRTEAVCAGQITAQGNELESGIVFIPRDQLSPVIHSCISAQLARMMGLPFALPPEAPSVLAAYSPHSHLTGLDRTLLRLLYHPRMTAGTPRDDAMTITRSVMTSLRSAGD